ncbi:MAG TPA: hypothetical protein VM370_13515 [Candidatus Thermoplasmatota archaeon]|nr:hypothetical protein [Candidatus Thermoplasmatota archaeon]
MRAAALLLAALLVAGCARDGPAPPSPTATSQGEPPTSSLSPVEPPSPSPPTTEALPPKVVANQTFDFNTEGDPTGRSPKERATEPVPQGYARVLVNVSLLRASVSPATLPVSGSVQQPKVRVVAANGTEVLVVDKEGAAESRELPALPGAWTVRYEGAGTMRASVLITAYA